MGSTTKTENFEETLEKLEKVVGSLEKGELPLGKSIEMFEEGIKMYSECKDFLVDAEKKIKVLTESLEEEEYEEK